MAQVDLELVISTSTTQWLGLYMPATALTVFLFLNNTYLVLLTFAWLLISIVKYDYSAIFIFCLFVWRQVCVYIAQVGFKLSM